MVNSKRLILCNKTTAVVFIAFLLFINFYFASKYVNLTTRRWIPLSTQSNFTEHAAKSPKKVKLLAAEIKASIREAENKLIGAAVSNHEDNFSGIKTAVPAGIIHNLSANKSSFIFVDLPVDNTSVTTHSTGDLKAVINDLKFAEGEITWIDPPGSFMERLPPYNEALNELRSHLLNQGKSPWRDLNEKITLLDGRKDDLFYNTRNTSLYTVALKRHNMTDKDGRYNCMKDTSNYLVQKYYMWSSKAPYCNYTKRLTKNYTNLSSRLTIYQCNENISTSQIPQCLKPIDHYSRILATRRRKPDSLFPEYFLHNYPEYIFYIHALRDGVVNTDGYAFTKSIKIVDIVCKVDLSVEPPTNYTNSPLYHEVFVISQFWGTAHYHKNAEDFPRIAPYVEFLQKNRDIKIHVQETQLNSSTAETLKMLGIDLPPGRLVQGVIRAKIVYLPQASNCGYSNQHSVQLASQLYRQYVDRTTSDHKINSLVMIRRTVKRLLADHEEKEDAMRRIATDHNLKFEVLSDDALPPFQDQVKIFRRAAVVVGSHGAGLVNMIYSEPGTLVIEGTGSLARLVLCFVRLAYSLGHHYHAIPSLGEWAGFINITTDTFTTEAKKAIDAHFNTRLKTD